MDTKYYLFGASGHAKVVVDIVLSTAIAIKSIVDDNPKVPYLLGISVIHTKNFEQCDTDQFIIAVGENTIRKKIVDNNNFNYFKAVHADATVSEFATIDKGSVVMPQAVVNAEAKIGKHCIINSRSVVEHDCVLEDYVHVSPNASLAGNVTVGKGAHIGIGAAVIQGINIGKWVTIGAGTVVLSDVPDYAVVVGNPGRIIKYNAVVAERVL